MSRLTLHLLGPPRVERNGKEIHIGRRKALALLAYLAVEGGAHQREALAALFWPEYDPSGARADLRRTLSLLRRKLGQDWLGVDRETACVDPNTDLWLDVAQFRDGLARCASHNHPPDQLCTTCVPALEEAVALYRGDFMAGFTLPDCLAFDDWQFFQTQGLRDQLAAALVRLVGWYTDTEEYARAIEHARRWLALDPTHEPAHRELMALYARAGQPSAALRQYQLCQQILREELELSPSPETTALYQDIRDQIRRRAKGSIASVQQTGAAEKGASVLPRHNLPLPLDPLVGRQTELDEIKARLADPACRLLTVLGPGGIGKTRLALQVALDLVGGPDARGPFRHGVFVVPLASVDTAGALVPTIAHALALSFSGATGADLMQREERELKPRLLGYLQGKDMLLVLDNFEQLLGRPEGSRGGEDLLLEMLEAAPGLKLLVTSREGLNLQSEWRFPLEGLAYPPLDGLGGAGPARPLADYEAVALFTRCAQRARPEFALTKEGDAVARICRLVEGMPLAIEMAAAWLKALPATGVAEQLQGGLDLLTSTWRDVPARHRSVRAAFEQSWRMLSEGERGVLRRLAVFRGSFDLRAANAVAGASLPQLAGLVEKSLLRAGAAGNYQLHELLRQYALEKLIQDPQEEAQTRARHSAYFLGWLQVQGEALKGPEQHAALGRLDRASDNIQAAWSWAAQSGQVTLLDPALEGLCLFYDRRRRAQEAEAACRLAAEGLQENSTGAALRLRAGLLAWAAGFCPPQQAAHSQQLLASSLRLLEQAESAGEDTRREKARALDHMGLGLWGQKWEQARRYHEHSLALWRELGDDYWTARLLEGLGWVSNFIGEVEKGVLYLQESLALTRRLDDRRGVAEGCRGLGTMLSVLGRTDEAVGLLREALALWRELGERESIALALAQLGIGLLVLGDLDEATLTLEESCNTWKESGPRSGEFGWGEIWLSLAKLHQGDYASAQARAQTCLALAHENAIADQVARSLWLLGDVALAKEAYAEADRLLADSVARWRDFGALAHELSTALADLSLAARGLGHMDAARQALHEALQIAVDLRTFTSLRMLVPVLSLLLADLGRADPRRFEQAVELYALASCDRLVDRSVWVAHVVGRHVAAASARLPPDVVAAAQQRGRARDCWETAEELLEELRSLGWAGTPASQANVG